MTTTLTERYIAATVKSLPAETQNDVRAELEASITDAVEARIEQGEEHEAAERTVLTELGDPGALAASYVDRPLHLIGPKYYLTWWRLLKLLLWIVTPCAIGGVALAQALADAPIGTIIGEAVVVGIAAIVHLSFWVTVVFAILERTGVETGTTWDVDQLPEPQSTGTGRSDLVVSLVFLSLTVGVLLWDYFRGFVRPDGEALPILNPALWPLGITALFVLIGLEAVLAIAIHKRGRWNTALAVVNTAIAVLFVSWALTLLVRGDLFNPELLDFILRVSGIEQDVLRILAILTGFGIVGFSAWDIVDGWLKRYRDAHR